MPKLSSSKILIGLTGGIACGKSTVARYLAEAGFTIIDADQLAHQLTAKGQPLLEKIKACFGASYLLADGSLNRKRLGKLIFQNKLAKAKLDTLMAKEIQEALQAAIDQASADLLILDIPLLFEQGYASSCQKIIVVSLPKEVQQARLQQRDACSSSFAQAKIASQLPLSQKCAQADFIIDNQQTKAELKIAVEKLSEKLKSLQKAAAKK